MKYQGKIGRGLLVMIFFVFISYHVCSAGSQTTDLTVVVKGLKNEKGNVKIALYDTPKGFNEEDGPLFAGTIVKINNKQAVWIFREIPIGTYAVKLYHDENSNNKLDTGLFGIPVEAYGFSNNARGMFGPPDFDAAKFEANQEHMTIEIKIP